MNVDTIKILGAILASILTLVSSVWYVSNVFTKDHKIPHAVSWGLLTVITGLAAQAQFAGGASWGAIVLLVTAICNLINFLLAISKNASHDINNYAVFCVAITILAVILWRLSSNPLWASIFLTLASVVAFIPTVMRTWLNPQMEVQRTYWLNTIRYLIAALALARYSWTTVLFPVTWFLINGLFSMYHAYRLSSIVTSTRS